MSNTQEKTAPTAAREARRPLWGSWVPPQGTEELSLNTDQVLTAPDVPAALAPAPPRPRVRAVSARVTDTATSGEHLAVGSLLGARYVIEEHISSGGFGAVYRASDRDIRHHQVALKLLHNRAASEDEKQSALRELRLLATVTHPSVVQFKEYGWHEGRLWFAMPWYRGQTLDNLIGDATEPVGMSRAEARPLFTRLAHGLAAMHAVGIQHHDIKPENIFVAEIAGFPGGLPVLLDLGIATQRGEKPIGLTVEYASPETAAAMLGDVSRPIGGAADVYSLALVLRNALDPTLATTANTTDLIPLLRERATKAVPLSRQRELAYMAPHFRRWLHRDPQKRPTAAELAQEFAILTEPEEKRQARVRFVQRAAPALLALGLTVTGLTFQLRRKETALVVQSRELRQERQVGETLRKQSAAQLDQLDRSARKLGDERRQLTQVLAFARSLNNQFTDVASRFEDLERRHAELKTERDALSLERERWNTERDGLTQAQAAVIQEREGLAAQRDQLNAELTRISGERDELARERDKLVAEQERALTEIRGHESRIDALTKEHDRLLKADAEADKRREAVARQRADALEEVKGRLAAANAEQAQLERKVKNLEARSAPAPRRASVKKKPKAKKRARSR